jgi:hypothetical protein
MLSTIAMISCGLASAGTVSTMTATTALVGSYAYWLAKGVLAAVRVKDGDSVTAALTEADSVAMAVTEADSVAVAVAEGDSVAMAVAETDSVAPADADGDSVASMLGVMDVDGVSEVDVLGDSEGEADSEGVTGGIAEDVKLADVLALPGRVKEGDIEQEPDVVPVMLGDADSV